MQPRKTGAIAWQLFKSLDHNAAHAVGLTESRYPFMTVYRCTAAKRPEVMAISSQCQLIDFQSKFEAPLCKILKTGKGTLLAFMTGSCPKTN
jgi:hypothetical protein